MPAWVRLQVSEQHGRGGKASFAQGEHGHPGQDGPGQAGTGRKERPQRPLSPGQNSAFSQRRAHVRLLGDGSREAGVDRGLECEDMVRAQGACRMAVGQGVGCASWKVWKRCDCPQGSRGAAARPCSRTC